MSVKVREKIKGSGEWYIFINHNNKRKAKKIGTDKRVAQNIAKQIEARLVLSDFNMEEKAIPGFGEYAEKWFNNQAICSLRESTYIRYKNILYKHIKPFLWNISIDKIKRSDVIDLHISLFNQGYAKSNLRMAQAIINSVMERAVCEELIQSNPADRALKNVNINKTKMRKPKEADPLNSNEVSLFLETCIEERPEYYQLFYSGFRTGLRIGELLALEWSNIDWNEEKIFINRSYSAGKIGLTKSGKSRHVDISDQLLVVLKELYKMRKLEALKEGRGDNIVEIIFHRNGDYLKQRNTRDVFKKILRIAGIRDRRIHDIRHSYGSLLLSAGVSPVYVKEQMGHSTISTTVDIYGKWIKSNNKSEVNNLDTTTKRNLYATNKNINEAS
ncbi:tyrosine-type recombinase/integrase [Candidatus Latescibacterota bacterium]